MNTCLGTKWGLQGLEAWAYGLGMTQQLNRYLTVAEAAHWAGVSLEAITESVMHGDLRAGTTTLIRLDHLDTWRRAGRARLAYLTLRQHLDHGSEFGADVA